MTAATDVRPAASMIEGWLDFASANRAFGWTCDRSHPGDALDVEIRLASDDGGTSEPLVVVRADRPRDDLKAGGFGSGRYGFDARFDLPEGADPARIVALARSPRTGSGERLGQVGGARGADRPAGDGGMAGHLQRIVGGLAVVRREHVEQITALRTEIGRDLARIAARAGTDAEDGRGLADRIEALTERVGAVEVFLVRIDGTLRDMDAAVRSRRTAEGPSRWRLALIGMGGVAAVALCVALARLALG